ncbi:MAG: ATP-binding cassette domain-containing protein [Eisenbergiella massiliensis]
MRINLNHLSMIYPNGRQALKDISLTLESPSLIGLVGPNGAGKSTLMKLLVAGLLPTGGTISVDDVPLSRCEKKLKEKLGYLPQDFGLYDELTVREFLDGDGAGNRDGKAAANPHPGYRPGGRGGAYQTLFRRTAPESGIAQALLGAGLRFEMSLRSA